MKIRTLLKLPEGNSVQTRDALEGMDMQKQWVAPPKGLKSVIALSLLLVVVIWPCLTQAAAPEASFPSPVGLVNDFANVLDDASEHLASGSRSLAKQRD